MGEYKEWDAPSGISTGELRRFELLSENAAEIAELDRVILEKGLSRRDLAIILFCLRVKPGFVRLDFGI